jgi:hypothetical protein
MHIAEESCLSSINPPAYRQPPTMFARAWLWMLAVLIILVCMVLRDPQEMDD